MELIENSLDSLDRGQEQWAAACQGKHRELERELCNLTSRSPVTMETGAPPGYHPLAPERSSASLSATVLHSTTLIRTNVQRAAFRAPPSLSNTPRCLAVLLGLKRSQVEREPLCQIGIVESTAIQA